LHVSFYGPTFNLADIWLRAGALIAIGGWLWQHRTRLAQQSAAPPNQWDRAPAA
jgi:lipoprotein signal peptidase